MTFSRATVAFMATRDQHTCIIFAAGDYYDSHDDPGDPQRHIPENALVIAADGGLDHARAHGIEPDIVIGDFDSIIGEPPNDATTIVLPAEKDDPDLLSALKVAWMRGAREFHVYGGLGGRIDHTVSNIQLMALLAQHGGIGYLHGDGTIVTAITDGKLSFAAHESVPGTMVSVFAHSDIAEDVNEPGLKYQLVHATLTNATVSGLSNEFLPGTPSSIDVADGTLIVTFPAAAPMPTVTRYRRSGGDLGKLDTSVSSVLAQPADNAKSNTSASKAAAEDAGETGTGTEPGEDRPTVLCYSRCSTCAKALKWLDEHHVEYAKRDIKSQHPDADELRQWHARSGLPIRRFFNTSGMVYRSLGLKDKLPAMGEDEALDVLSSNGMLVKRPLVVSAHGILVGFDPKAWDKALL